MDNDRIVRKLQQQETPRILISDIDGTLFSPNFNLLTAPFFNTQTAAFLKKNHIPFIVATGRSFWRKIDRYHLTLLGIPQPDAVITANGTVIYYLQNNDYISDFTWQGIMQSTKVTDESGNLVPWNKWDITNTIINYLKINHCAFSIERGNTYLIRLRFNTCKGEQIQKIKKDIGHLFPKGIRIILTEKLLWKNSLDIFSGEMLITPATAGKDKAVHYLLKNFSLQLHKPIHALLFGDATVDVPMLTMKADEKFYSLKQYGIHPTPLAQFALQEKMKTNPHLTILYGDGPREILWTLRPELRKEKQHHPIPVFTLQKKTGFSPLHGRIPSLRHSERSEESHQSQHVISNEVRDLNNNKLSPAQNSKVRKVIRVFEGFLDKIVDKNLSPNEISFLGLEKLSQGLTLLHKPKSSMLEKAKGLYQYSFGNLTDVLDGIRARRSDKREENGQLVDGFADRAKEFMQLFTRAKKRMNGSTSLPKKSFLSDSPLGEESEDNALHTFLAAISCALPSIARAQVEISGKTVNERDEKGGSMIDRTKRLFLSLLFETVGLADQSLAKDKEILTTNIATFQNRLYSSNKVRSSQFFRTIKQEQLSDFQKKALERFLLYVDVLQQEDVLIKKYLAKYPKLLKEYEKESQKLAKNYFGLPVGKLRKMFGIKNYKLEIKKHVK